MEYGFKKREKTEVLRNHLNLGGESPDGETIEVTSKWLERGKKPFIGVMGEYHFSRAAADTWADELAKMKAGGITIVSTYVIWIYHEETEGVFDFDGDRDLYAFVNLCKKMGLDVIIRIGPWCHGEVRNGGFPDWLLEKPFALREDNEEYLRLVRRWYTKIYEETKGLFFKDGGNIIGIQLENEFTDDAKHLKTLKDIAIECGLVAPLYTVTGWNSAAGAKIPVDDVMPVFGGYCDAPWNSNLLKTPPSSHFTFNRTRNDSAIGADLALVPKDGEWRLPYERYPFATCELGGGLQNTHHRRYIINPMDIYALSLVKLGCGNNLIGYYMYHGNTNKIGRYSTFQESSATGYPNDYPILSYDFQAPISEYGEIREHYRLLNMLHMFVNSFGEKLAATDAVESTQTVAPDDFKSLRYGMRTDGESGFVFVNHYCRGEKLCDIHGAVIDTGCVKFPPIDVCGDIAFFMPFNMDINGYVLKYATVQPLCKVGETYFFAEIPGIKAEYDIADDAKKYIVTLPWEKARFLRVLDGELFLGDGCDLYLGDGASVMAAENKAYSFGHWNGREFENVRVNLPYDEAVCEIYESGAPKFKKPYLYELNIGGGRKITWKRVAVSGASGFVEFDFKCDAMQLYADGELVADMYYYGVPWRIPAKMIYGKECYLAYSDMRNDFYREF